MEAIDEADRDARGPPAPTPSWLRNLPCARVARIRVVLGVLAIPFAIKLVLSWMARVAMMTRIFFGIDCCCADLAVSLRTYSILKNTWYRRP